MLALGDFKWRTNLPQVYIFLCMSSHYLVSLRVRSALISVSSLSQIEYLSFISLTKWHLISWFLWKLSWWVLLSSDLYWYDHWDNWPLPPWIASGMAVSWSGDNTSFLPHILLWMKLGLIFNLVFNHCLDALHYSILQNILHSLRQIMSTKSIDKFYHIYCFGTLYITSELLLIFLISLHVISRKRYE